MRTIPFFALQQSVSPLTEGYLWLAAAAFLLLLLLVGGAYLLLQYGRTLLAGPLDHFDAWLSTHAPRFWMFIKRRFTREEWHGLALTGAAFCFFLSTYLFALVTEGWTDQEALYLVDQRVYELFAGALSDSTVAALRLITHAGDLIVVGGITIALALYFAYRKARWRLVALALAVGGGQAVLWSMKWIFGRARPDAQLTSAVGHAFPSGHSFSAMVLYGFLIFLAWRARLALGARLFITGGLALLVVLVGLSRVLLSVHWTSDVLGGFLVGLAWLLFSLVFTRALRAYRTRFPQAS